MILHQPGRSEIKLGELRSSQSSTPSRSRVRLCALAACLRGTRDLMTRQQAARIEVPVLIAVGTADDVAGSAGALGAIIPGSQVLDIPGRDHMRAVGDKVYKAGVLDFLSRRA